MVFLNREDKQNKYFYVYEIFNEKITRKVRKQEVKDENSDAFDVDVDGKFIIYTAGEELIVQSVRIPEVVQKYLKPRYKEALH